MWSQIERGFRNKLPKNALPFWGFLKQKLLENQLICAAGETPTGSTRTNCCCNHIYLMAMRIHLACIVTLKIVHMLRIQTNGKTRNENVSESFRQNEGQTAFDRCQMHVREYGFFICSERKRGRERKSKTLFETKKKSSVFGINKQTHVFRRVGDDGWLNILPSGCSLRTK